MNTRKVRMHQAEVLRNAGHKQQEIAEILGVSDRMVRYYLNPQPQPEPEPKHRLLDPCKEYITAKLDDTPHYNLMVLRKELHKLGCSGGMTILRIFAKQVRDKVVKRAVIRIFLEYRRIPYPGIKLTGSYFAVPIIECLLVFLVSIILDLPWWSSIIYKTFFYIGGLFLITKYWNKAIIKIFDEFTKQD